MIGRVLRAFGLTAFAAAGCGNAPASPTPSTTASDSASPPSHSAASGFSRASCSGPPATLSLGTYPTSVEEWVQIAGYALLVTVQAVNQVPPVCVGKGASGNLDALRVDQALWGGFLQGGESVGMVDQSFAAGQRLLILGSDLWGASGGCYVVNDRWPSGPPSALDISQYPNAATDMARLHAFVADRASYDQLIAAQRVADATVGAAGSRVNYKYLHYYVDLTLEVHRTLCGDKSSPVTARYFGLDDQGVTNPAGNVPPTMGTELVVMLGTPTGDSPAQYDMMAVVASDQWSPLSALLSSPPTLSL